jgi:uncharacterized protein (DUF58 family)
MRLTARGTGLAAGSAVLIGAGFTFGYAELALLGSAGALALICATGYAMWRPRLSVQRRAEPDRVSRGEASTVTLTVTNESRLRTATLIAHDQCGPARIPVPLLRLRPGRDTEVSYPVPTRRRGVVEIGPLLVTRGDPLGLVRMARTHGGVNRVWVHPRSYPLAAVPAGITRSLDGLFDRVPHGGITFATLREYVVGDELRQVHWRTSARVGELMVREHVDTSLPRIVVLLDDRAASWPDRPDGPDGDTGRAGGTGPEDSFEAACEAAASVVISAVRAGLTVALHLVRQLGAASTADGRRDATQVRALLDRLAEASPGGAANATVTTGGAENATVEKAHGRAARSGDPLTDASNRLRQHRLGDTLVYLTGAGGVADLGLVAGLRGAYPAVVVGVLGADTPAPSAAPGVLVLDAADGAEFASAWDGVRSW